MFSLYWLVAFVSWVYAALHVAAGPLALMAAARNAMICIDCSPRSSLHSLRAFTSCGPHRAHSVGWPVTSII